MSKLQYTVLAMGPKVSAEGSPKNRGWHKVAESDDLTTIFLEYYDAKANYSYVEVHKRIELEVRLCPEKEG